MTAKNSIVTKIIQDDIFTFGPSHCDAMVIWMKSGFSGLYTKWWHDFLPRLKNVQLQRQHSDSKLWVPFEVSSNRMWESVAPTLLQIQPSLGKTRFLYVMPNTTNSWADTNEVNVMMSEALMTVSRLPVKSVCFNGIQGASPDGGHSSTIDSQHAQLMLKSIQNWNPEGLYPSSLEFVYLVDLGDGFVSS